MFKPSCAVFVGDGTLLIRCAEAWLSEGHAIAAVASADPAILQWAGEQGITSEAITGAPRLEGVEFDYLFSVAWLHVLPETLITRARKLALNFHDGPLPRLAGLNATAWAVMTGERQHGVTWHEMTAQVDEGRIACQSLFDLAPDETAFSLNARCYEAGFQSFRSLLPALAHGELALQPQAGERSYFGRHHRPPALATLDFSRPAADLHALGRGLSFGNYANPLALPKVWLGGDELLLARSTRLPGTRTGGAPGTVLEVQGDRVRVATADGDLVLEGCCRLDGSAPAGLQAGHVLPALDTMRRQRLDERAPRLARGEVFWREAQAQVRALQLPYPLHTPTAEDGASAPRVLRLDAMDRGPATLAAFTAWLSAMSGQEQVSILYADAALADQALGIEAWADARVPVTVSAQPRATVAEASASAEALLGRVRQAGPLTRDLRLRAGAHASATLPTVGLSLGGPRTGAPLLLELRTEQAGQALELQVDARAFSAPVAQLMARHLEAWLQAFARAEPGAPVAGLSLLPPHEAAQIEAINSTAVSVDLSQPVHGQIVGAAAAKPDAEALRWDDQSLTRAELHARSDALARVLCERGVQPGDAVGVCLERNLDLVISVLAILKAGAAYLPLDPEYPRDRLRYMVADSGTRLVVCGAEQADLLGLGAEQAVAPDARPASATALLPAVRADSTAYLIYTSGSTGQPKGVMVTHANVLNFFAGMDRRVPRDEGARWLAVTSLSFDISVLELLWTLSRGVPVVLYANASAAHAQAGGPAFSLFYFSSDESAADTADRYRLLMEGARFADENGFAAVWTPERHFHAFGGLYPNPMVASAAIAAITRRVQIRAGSCVLPLHHPARVAEDWALVDNLSRGRVGVSFAAGWQPNDFVLAPQNFANRKQLMLDGIDTVRRLWSGETVEFPGHDGKPVAVRTLPRPVQRQLPMWLTAASNPETFQQAGEKGCNVLTHLLGQKVEDVAQKVAVYREAWRKAGHSGQGQVTIMLHTFVGPDEDQVRETARGPMKTYLRSSVDLIRQAAWSFPTFVQRGAAAGRTPLEVMQEQPLSEAETDALLDHAFSRYWNTSALIGTPERCLAMVQKLQDAGVDEIACLIDFGIATDTVLSQLHDLRRLMQLAQQPRRALVSVSSQLARHDITHLQCTPSMATMLVADAEGRAGLSRLSAMLVGGEALPLPLATQLRELVPGKLLNMYGPTETTVWSSCCDLAQVGELVPLGEPIANTQLHVRNAWGQECPALVPGELLIGGDGVTRGYLNRPELNAERFVAEAGHASGRLYRTGDLVRRHPDGRLEFLGRLDHQVKIRGHRIELGEIENALASQPGVREAVVIARQDSAGEAFLVGYVTAVAGQAAPDADTLRRDLAERLPDIMVPRLISVRSSFPLTPNGKIDRKALAQVAAPAAAAGPTAAPAAAAAVPTASAATDDPLEQTVAGIWCQVLGLPEVGRESNFFDLGGHSLLVIQVQRRLKDAVGQEVSITDMFRLTTVAAIAEHLRGNTRETAVNDGRSRAQARRALRSARTA